MAHGIDNPARVSHHMHRRESKDSAGLFRVVGA